jgi:hypothetical protein
MKSNLTDEELEVLALIAEAFAVGEPWRPDHPLAADLIRKGVIRGTGTQVVITDFGADLLRAHGHRGPLPLSRAKVLASRKRKQPARAPDEQDPGDDAEVR